LQEAENGPQLPLAELCGGGAVGMPDRHLDA
jgi:hypothetical protein